MSKPATDNRLYSYSDYLTWPANERWEIIQGRPRVMSPSPGLNHQVVLLALASQFYSQLQGKACRVFIAPFDVLLADPDTPDQQVTNVVQPDLFVICDQSKLSRRRVKGAPDLIVEVLSPSSVKHDRYEKFLLYEQAGVREYWLVEPEAKLLTVFRLNENGRYGRPDLYAASGPVCAGVLPELVVDLETVFAGVESPEDLP
ncbi:Uma2 family endonuclease [Desulfallas sp. Bu1-1]|uniref:Uma2 family endonuclease n=1 Tax=Desulfallas sp. Bu1-1 TaxID=2787620 RepID=UPI0018A00D34|nr:Uma2 family endonuclease [Desulfallas sp. Bu1-1]MBF7082289.1 Uma2 family endonuclease [Desulfallas sp. Bu1-1]